MPGQLSSNTASSHSLWSNAVANAPKSRWGKIASLADDLSLALSAKSIRIQAPVPGKGYVGIEVPNNAKPLRRLPA